MDLTFISLINEEHIFMYSGPFVKNLFEFFCSFFFVIYLLSVYSISGLFIYSGCESPVTFYEYLLFLPCDYF